MHNQQMKHLMRGAWILSLSSLIAKILSAVYRVPFQNMVGDTGFYAYQQIYPIYGLGMTFALSGFPVISPSWLQKLTVSKPNEQWPIKVGSF